MSKLTAYLIGGQPVGTVVKDWSDTDLSGNPAFLIEETVSAGYQDISSIETWDNFGDSAGATCSIIRDEISTLYGATTWAALTSTEKEIVSRWFVADKVDRDTIKTAAEQEEDAAFLSACIESQSYDLIDQISTGDSVDVDTVVTNGTANPMDWTLDQGVININNLNIDMQIDDLSDVDTTGKTDGQILSWNNTSGKWEPITGGGGSDNLGNHTATQDLNMATFNIDAIGKLYASDGAIALPTYSFTSNNTTGMYLEASGDLAFSVDSLCTLEIDASGRVFMSSQVPNYETLVTTNQTLTNKKYVDDKTWDASDIVSGTFADTRIAQSNVTQYQAAFSITESQISDLGSYALSSHSHDWDEATGTADTIPFNSALTKPAHSEGLVFYDKDEHTISVYNDESEVTHQLGQEGYVRVYNSSGSTITNGSAVYVTGNEGVENRPTIGLADASSSTTSGVIGIVTHDIENNTFGYVTTWGLVNDLDTSGCVAGDTIYLSDTTPGGFVNVAPTSPSIVVELGHVTRSHSTLGKVLVWTSVEGAVGPQGPPGPGAVEVLAAGQVRRTTAYTNIPLTFTDLAFDTTDIETNVAAVEHNADTIHFDIKETGTYEIFFNLIADDELTAKAVKNDSVDIPGSEFIFGDTGDTINANFPMGINVLHTFTAGDTVKLQIKSATTSENLSAGATFGVMKLEGIKGDQGPAGTNGDIVWKGAWISQNYIVNDTVEYNGSSYVCILNTVSNEIPTNTTYWDLVAAKGDQGIQGTAGAGMISGISKNSGANVNTASRSVLNFIEGTNITLDIVDDAGGDEVDVTINAVAVIPTVTEASATSTITRSDSTFALATSMTLTPAAGTYMVWFSSTITNNGNGGQTEIAIFSGGTQVTHTKRSMSIQSNAVTGTNFPVATNGLVTVNGSQAIEIHWRAIEGGPATMYERTLNIMKVS